VNGVEVVGLCGLCHKDELFSVQDVTFDVPADRTLQLRRD